MQIQFREKFSHFLTVASKEGQYPGDKPLHQVANTRPADFKDSKAFGTVLLALFSRPQKSVTSYTKLAAAAPNRLQQQFTIDLPDRAWGTDITSSRTYEGWLYLAVVMNLASRRIINWSMKPTLAKEIVLEALLMAIWRRQPKQDVLFHSDQGAQFSSDDWNRFCQIHGLLPSMSRQRIGMMMRQSNPSSGT